MAVMTNNEFIKKLKEIEALPTTYYSVSGGDWAKWNGKSWNFDCVILVKAILWGWNGDKKASHGGAKYASNRVYDDDADQIINRCCKNVSTNFSNIAPGELLWMAGHVGVYIGGGKVIECTAAWEGKVVISDIDTKGKRSRNGVTCGYWKKHGYLSYIEYLANEEPKPAAPAKPAGKKFNIGDKVIFTGYLYRDSQGNGQGKYLSNHRGTITILADGPKPYHFGTLGWVAEADLRPVDNGKVYKTVANCDWLNLRTSPSYGNNIYKAVRAGTKVEYLGMSSGWAKVDYNGKVVYCGASYLK